VAVVVHLSDLHLGDHVGELAESMLADVRARRPDLVVVSGDLTQRALRSEFADARELLKRLPSPVLSVVGNHDLPLVHLMERLLRPSRRYEHFISRNLDPVFVSSDLMVLGLDSMPPWRWKSGHLSARQIGLVRDTLGSGPAGAWRLLVTHHPVLPAGRSGLVGRRPLVEACAESGVSVFLSGHTHLPSVDVVSIESKGVRRRAVAVGAGTAISKRTRGVPNSYAVLDFAGPMDQGGALTVQILQPEGTDWTVVRSDQFAPGPDGVVASVPT
jgi:3',5'-cyclic AMP phosphodiesterase CpdA